MQPYLTKFSDIRRNKETDQKARHIKRSPKGVLLMTLRDFLVSLFLFISSVFVSAFASVGAAAVTCIAVVFFLWMYCGFNKFRTSFYRAEYEVRALCRYQDGFAAVNAIIFGNSILISHLQRYFTLCTAIYYEAVHLLSVDVHSVIELDFADCKLRAVGKAIYLGLTVI